MLGAACLPGKAAAWWNDDWAFRKQINLDLSAAGANVTGSPADVPVLIRLHTGNFTYFGDAKADGSDLRFVAADDVTPLKFHVERFDAVNQMALLWVRVPRLTGGTSSDFIYLYYGNADAVAGGDAAGTYDANQVLVYHFSEANGIPSDATAYANQPAQFGATLTSASLIGGGAVLDGSAGIELPTSPSLRVLPDQGVTASAWVRFDAPQSDAYVVAAEDAAGNALMLGIAGTTPFARASVGGMPVEARGPELPIAEWHHLALRLGGGRLALFVDGVEAGAVDAALPEIAAPFVVGRAAAGANGFIGELDELAISNTARSPDWLKAIAASQGMLSTLAIYGGDSQRESGGGESYFATTMRNVTVDGWVVIAFLGVMFVVSVWVILVKAVLLGRIERENSAFIAAYRGIGAGDPLALAKGVADTSAAESPSDAAMQVDRFVPSTLFPLYVAGVNEVRHRLRSPAVGAQRSGFTAETMGAIRATVDAVFVRERQKLNAKMVLLTIAISGGPFLGLLGTVVGVMVTFAAIAASGDVNVTAIAPGIAAALVATVAGLGVAIPALFAYNWLGARIKDIDAETHVFGDEFVNRLAEHYA
jgi:biopolymer transport protein ExbB